MSGSKVYGVVRTWNVERGFGFIGRDDGDGDVFAHVAEFPARMAPPIGTRVALDLMRDVKSQRLRATRIELI